MIQHNKLIGFENTETTYFAYEPLPLCGIGKHKHPIISMDPYIDISKNLEMHSECCRGLAQIETFKMAMFPGTVHRSESDLGKINFTEMLYNLDHYDPTGIHKENLEWLNKNSKDSKRSMYKYMYFAMGANIPWFFAYYLRVQHFMEKLSEPDNLWTDEAKKLFPNLINYIGTLPFKTIGRVLFFTTYPNAGVTAHRDLYVAPHKDQNINLFFSGWRPSYVWDDVKNKKFYLAKDATSYFFNNRDYHGVDPEPNFRYTLRIDGVFEDWLQEELGMVDGYVWNGYL